MKLLHEDIKNENDKNIISKLFMNEKYKQVFKDYFHNKQEREKRYKIQQENKKKEMLEKERNKEKRAKEEKKETQKEIIKEESTKKETSVSNNMNNNNLVSNNSLKKQNINEFIKKLKLGLKKYNNKNRKNNTEFLNKINIIKQQYQEYKKLKHIKNNEIFSNLHNKFIRHLDCNILDTNIKLIPNIKILNFNNVMTNNHINNYFRLANDNIKLKINKISNNINRNKTDKKFFQINKTNIGNNKKLYSGGLKLKTKNILNLYNKQLDNVNNVNKIFNIKFPKRNNCNFYNIDLLNK